MIIHQPEIKVQNGEIRVSSRVEMQVHGENLPEELWFAFPEENAPYVTDRGDGFLTSLIFPAMYFGESIDIRGVVSPKLAFNLEVFQQFHHLMLPKIFTPVEVKYNKLSELSSNAVIGGIGTSFSGGIDSSYVIWDHHIKHNSNPYNQLSHGLYIQGFDIALDESDLYQSLSQKYEVLFERWGLNLILARSNFMEFTEFRINWLHAHNGLQIGCAQVLGKLFKRFIKPGGDEMYEGHVEEPGYNIHLLSTETMDIELHSAHILRMDKLARMATWEDIQDYLFVCMNSIKTKDGTPCYDCAKCLNTLIYLELLDLQPKFPNFSERLSIKFFLIFLVRNLFSSIGLAYYREHLPRYAKLARRYDFLFAFWLFFIPSEVLRFLKVNLLGFFPKNLQYKIKQKIYG